MHQKLLAWKIKGGKQFSLQDWGAMAPSSLLLPPLTFSCPLPILATTLFISQCTLGLFTYIMIQLNSFGLTQNLN